MADRWKTGEDAPESGDYKFESYEGDNGERKQADTDMVVNLEEGERFPPVPAVHGAAYWVKA